MIHKISVIGAGRMGQCIASEYARHGYLVSLYDPYEETVKGVLGRIEADLKFMAQEGVISESVIPDTLSRISVYTDLKAAVKDADYLIEAVPEDLTLKQDLMAKLDELCPSHTIFATNTSSLKLSDITSKLPQSRKELSLVVHWYNPPHLIPLVEVSSFGDTAPQVYEAVYNLHLKCEKEPINVRKDLTGMVANRILHSQAREIFHLMEIGAASAEDIDRALKFGPGFRSATTGILESADMGGLDIWLIGEDNMLPTLCNDGKACDMLRNKVAEGKLGMKTGEGFYSYSPEEREQKHKDFQRRLMTQYKVSKTY